MEDKVLIWKFKRGSREALRRIYEKYHGGMLKLAVALAGDVGVAEDVVQDVFVRFAQSADRIGLAGSLKSYLTTSVVNGVRNRHRDEGRRRVQGLEDAAFVASGEIGPERWAVLSEEMERLRGALAELPYEQREAVTLRLEGGMTFRQIAGLQGTSISTVNGRYRYGIERLRSLLDGEVSDEEA